MKANKPLWIFALYQVYTQFDICYFTQLNIMHSPCQLMEEFIQVVLAHLALNCVSVWNAKILCTFYSDCKIKAFNYHKSKSCFATLHSHCTIIAVQTISARVFSVYGPKESVKSVAVWMKCILISTLIYDKNRIFSINADASSSENYIQIECTTKAFYSINLNKISFYSIS